MTRSGHWHARTKPFNFDCDATATRQGKAIAQNASYLARSDELWKGQVRNSTGGDYEVRCF
jgi:hypothetical protein